MRALTLVVAGVLLLVAPPLASADVYNVNTTTDPVPDQTCAGVCTLREAVDLAGAADGTVDTINVPAGTYVLERGDLSLNGDVLIGAGARSTIIDGNGNDRVFGTTNGGLNDGLVPSISGVTIRNGLSAAPGGGVSVTGSLSIANSQVLGNRAPQGGGIALDGGDSVTLIGSTVAGNTATTSSGSAGGGIYSNNEGQILVLNSTISGNVARDSGPNNAQGGGLRPGSGTITILSNATVAGNEASPNNGGGIYLVNGANGAFVNSINAGNTGGGCAFGGGALQASSHHNLVTDSSCGATGPGSVTGDVAGLGSLTNNGGPTDTRALPANSLAINAGSQCASTDQRGIARPAACDIGAFEYVAPVLTVTTGVVNNDGGEDQANDFSVHVRDAAGNEVSGSPQPGNAGGTSYTLVPGSFRVSGDGANLYTVAVGGACAADGSVAIGENQTATCTVTADDRRPRAGREVGAIPVRGTVRIKKPGGRFRIMRESDILPNGTTVDTLKGRITLIAPANRSGKETKADFYDGIFKLSQNKKSRPTTTLTLVEKLRCPKAGAATTAAKRKKKRRLWGDGSGKFRTKGKHSAATVVGTKWLVEDRCTSTLTRVVRGRVSVRDFVKKKTITVRRGKRYIARAD